MYIGDYSSEIFIWFKVKTKERNETEVGVTHSRLVSCGLVSFFKLIDDTLTSEDLKPGSKSVNFSAGSR